MKNLVHFFLTALSAPDGDMSAKRLIAAFLILNAVIRSYIPDLDVETTRVMVIFGCSLLGLAALTKS